MIPVLNRPQNVAPLVESFHATQKGVANLYFIVDMDDTKQIEAIVDAGADYLVSTHGSSYAQKVNAAFEQTTEPWLFPCGDDVKFHNGWIDAARKLSDRYDVIGVNDLAPGEVHIPGKVGNPFTASGAHADHFFVRRAYADEYGASLSGPIAHEGYRHFYVDVEIVELAKARGVWAMCPGSRVEHLHPDVGKAEVDDTYRKGWATRELDHAEWTKRRDLVAMQSEGLGKVRAA